MATHALGTGTVNLLVNLPTDCRDVLGKSAASHAARSTGAWVRKLLLKGLEAEDPAAAMRMRQALRQYYGAALLLIFLGLVLPNSHDMRRARGIRRNRVETEEVSNG